MSDTVKSWRGFLVNFRGKLRGLRSKIERACHPLIAWSGLLCAAYYLFFSRAYWREQKSVAAGMALYGRDGTRGEVFMLRRNIHRLEKGLIMPKRRAVFGVEFIMETVTAFGSLAVKNGEPELSWAYDVLERYFSVVGDHPRVAAAHRAFSDIKLDAIDRDLVPFVRSDIGEPQVTFEQFEKIIARRRSVRLFLSERVPRGVLDKAMLAGGKAPSACNRQPIRFHIVDEPATVRAVASLAGGTRGFAEGYPSLVVVTGNLAAYFTESDRHVIYIDGALTAMSFMLALETLGLSSCVINWADRRLEDTQLNRPMGFPRHERAVMLIAVGYADPTGFVPCSTKQNLDQLRAYHDRRVRSRRLTAEVRDEYRDQGRWHGEQGRSPHAGFRARPTSSRNCQQQILW